MELCPIVLCIKFVVHDFIEVFNGPIVELFLHSTVENLSLDQKNTLVSEEKESLVVASSKTPIAHFSDKSLLKC